jgi:1,4-dihydroxy-2-naphthoate octaprenyltransferase
MCMCVRGVCVCVCVCVVCVCVCVCVCLCVCVCVFLCAYVIARKTKPVSANESGFSASSSLASCNEARSSSRG